MSGEEVPEGFARMTAGQVDGHPADSFAHPAADLDQTQAQRGELEAGEPHLPQPASQGIQQPVRGGMQEQAKLVGPETMATEPVGKAAMLEVLDPLFGGAALDIPVVESQRGVRTGRDHEAGIGTLGQDLGFVDDPALVRPGLGGIEALTGQAHLLAGLWCCARASASSGAARASRRGLVGRPMV